MIPPHECTHKIVFHDGFVHGFVHDHGLSSAISHKFSSDYRTFPGFLPNMERLDFSELAKGTFSSYQGTVRGKQFSNFGLNNNILLGQFVWFYLHGMINNVTWTLAYN